ncbi:MAG: HYR domain-containing protein, partial [Bacteroidota bacterium]
MKNIFTIIFLFLISFTTLCGQGIFDASIHTAVTFGMVNSPLNEGVQQIIDQDPATKFLDFIATDGMGFEVDLLGEMVIASSIEIVTANDAPERDPTDFEIFGSTDGVNFESVATGAIPCVPDRFLSRIFAFSNSSAYSYYRINFTGTCNPTDINQVADVQLYTTIGNAPVFSCPADMTISTAGTCDAVGMFDVQVEDAEDGTLTPTQTLGPATGEAFPLGTTAVVFVAEDSDGNAVSCEFTITVEDTEAPTFDCPSDLTVATINAGDPDVVVDYTVTVADNCSPINPLANFTSLTSIGNKSYYLSDGLFTTEDAFIDALVQDGFLGTIRNADENQFLLDAILRNNNGLADIIIGYNDVDIEGTFVWQSEDLSTYNNWNTGEPNNAGAGGVPENYTVIQNNGTWNDVDASGSRRYLFETDFELLQIQGLESGASFPVGMTTNTFETSDAAGNVGTCEFTVTVENTVRTIDPQLEDDFIISPNPVSEQLIINNPSSHEIQQISILGTDGKVLRKKKVDISVLNPTLDISSLPSGIYLLKIE